MAERGEKLCGDKRRSSSRGKASRRLPRAKGHPARGDARRRSLGPGGSGSQPPSLPVHVPNKSSPKTRCSARLRGEERRQPAQDSPREIIVEEGEQRSLLALNNPKKIDVSGLPPGSFQGGRGACAGLSGKGRDAVYLPLSPGGEPAAYTYGGAGALSAERTFPALYAL